MFLGKETCEQGLYDFEMERWAQESDMLRGKVTVEEEDDA